MKPRRRYTDEFKAQALELCATGKPVAEVAADLRVGQDLIYAWRRKANQPAELCIEGQGAVGDEDVAEELSRLRREVTSLRIDNDILKKAAVILGTQTPNKSTK